MAKTRVIIIGGGFAGINAARKLKKTSMDVLLIDRTNHHLFQPLLYEVATAALSPGEIATPLREIFSKQNNTSVIMGEVVQIDTKNQQIQIANGDLYGYDYLIVAPGARHAYFGRNEWEEFAPGLKTIRDALKIREQILLSFEKAERLHEGEEVAKYLNFVIIGGGPTGVEMAGAIAEIAHKTLFSNFRRIKPEKSKIYLIEALPQILPSYPPKLAERARRDLEKLGVTVVTGKKVTQITADHVQVETLSIPSQNVIWAAGNQASSLLKTLNTPLDRQGRVIVGPDLSLPEVPNIFVIGDAACVMHQNNPLPATAPAAIQEGRYVAKIIEKNLPSNKRPPFRFTDKGSMATIGKAKAIVMLGKLQFTGVFAWLMWAFIHIAYLIGFRNRLGVLLEWIAATVTGQRGVRLITNRPIDPEIPRSSPPSK